MNIALIGYGKMGKAIEEIALAKGHKVPLKITSTNLSDLTPRNLQTCDVAIEFTNPESAVQNMLTCFNAKVPVVCGSTGWLHLLKSVETDCLQKDGALIYASNFSVGVNIFFELNEKLAQLMRDLQGYTIQLKETHHTQKKDAPSGTAISLADQIISEIPRKNKWVNHPTDKENELAIISERTDPAPGTHSVIYTSAIDTIEITHTAHNRKGFAAGAVLAAEFIKDKKGIFTMKDVLNIKSSSL